MGVYVALLRAVNLPKNNRIVMARWRAALESAGFGDVVTLLQSGNAVFTAPAKSAAKVASHVEAAIAEEFDAKVTVLARSRAEIAKVLSASPMPDGEKEPSKYVVAFLSGPVTKGVAAALDDAYEEDVRAGPNALYIWYRNGLGRSKLTNQVIERRAGEVATVRNWNTVTKIKALMDERA